MSPQGVLGWLAIRRADGTKSGLARTWTPSNQAPHISFRQRHQPVLDNHRRTEELLGEAGVAYVPRLLYVQSIYHLHRLMILIGGKTPAYLVSNKGDWQAVWIVAAHVFRSFGAVESPTDPKSVMLPQALLHQVEVRE